MLASGFVNRVTGAVDKSVSPPAEGQPYGEPGAPFRRMAGLDRPADALDQSVDDRQPQPGSDAANAAIALVQRRSVERDSQIVVGQARAAVPNLDDEVRRGGQLFQAGRQDDRGTGRGHAPGVLEQAVEHLPQPG